MAIKSKTKNLKGDKSLEEIQDQVQQIENGIKAGNGYDSMIINKIEDIIHKAESEIDDGLIKEEKAFLLQSNLKTQ
ncbi:MAG: hypothetical protein WAM42_16875 [Candidatus Nitrosopolaris sp.]|jgi:hypothetical protein